MFDFASMVQRELGFKGRRRTPADMFQRTSLMPQNRDPNASDYSGHNKDLEEMLRDGSSEMYHQGGRPAGGRGTTVSPVSPVGTVGTAGQDTMPQANKEMMSPDGFHARDTKEAQTTEGLGDGKSGFQEQLAKLQGQIGMTQEQIDANRRALETGKRPDGSGLDDDSHFSNALKGLQWGAKMGARGHSAYSNTPAGATGYTMGSAVGGALHNLFKGSADERREMQGNIETGQAKIDALKKEQERVVELETKAQQAVNTGKTGKKIDADTAHTQAQTEDLQDKPSRYTRPIEAGGQTFLVNERGETVTPTDPETGKPIVDKTKAPVSTKTPLSGTEVNVTGKDLLTSETTQKEAGARLELDEKKFNQTVKEHGDRLLQLEKTDATQATNDAITQITNIEEKLSKGEISQENADLALRAPLAVLGRSPEGQEKAKNEPWWKKFGKRFKANLKK